MKKARIILADDHTLVQTKLLRVLQEGEFERLGSSQTIKVDVRIIAATNRSELFGHEKGALRQDQTRISRSNSERR